MRLTRALAIASSMALASWSMGCAQRKQEQPSITFGTARISLGMTMEEVKQRLSEAAMHIDFKSPDKNMAYVIRNGELYGLDGGITFHDGYVIDAVLSMPNAKSAEDLAEQISNAVNNMETKLCTASSNRTGTSESAVSVGTLQTSFVCGSRRIGLLTMRVWTPNHETTTTTVSVGIGQLPAK